MQRNMTYRGFMDAAASGDAAYVKAFVVTEDAMSISSHIRDDKSQHMTALMVAAKFGRENVVAEILSYLAEQKAASTPENPSWYDLNTLDELGNNALIYAATNGHLIIVNQLLETGEADPRNRDINGNTPADIATMMRHHKVAERLSSAMKETDRSEKSKAAKKIFSFYNNSVNSTFKKPGKPTTNSRKKRK